MIRGVQEDQV